MNCLSPTRLGRRVIFIFGRSLAVFDPTDITSSLDYRFMFLSFHHSSVRNTSTIQLDAFQEREASYKIKSS